VGVHGHGAGSRRCERCARSIKHPKPLHKSLLAPPVPSATSWRRLRCAPLPSALFCSPQLLHFQEGGQGVLEVLIVLGGVKLQRRNKALGYRGG
jgi:hypothetical protein